MKRIYHHWSKWECVAGGMYETAPPAPLTPDEARQCYQIFLRDIPRFEKALDRVITEWPISCEQFLSNENINRIAWLGQSSMCIETRVPACFRAGFRLLNTQEQRIANRTALTWLNKWLHSRNEMPAVMVDLESDDDEESVVPLEGADTIVGTVAKVNHYIDTWKRCGYAQDIPEEVPNELMRKLLAPSYKAICFAILKNDLPLKSLGFVPRESSYYGILKRMEIAQRPKTIIQMELF